MAEPYESNKADVRRVQGGREGDFVWYGSALV